MLLLPPYEEKVRPPHAANDGKELLGRYGGPRGRQPGPGTSQNPPPSSLRSLVSLKGVPNNSIIF